MWGRQCQTRVNVIAQWKKTVASWMSGEVLCLSVPFTWLMPKAEALAKRHSGPVWVGGPAVRLLGLPAWASKDSPRDWDGALARHNPDATFTTRGCLRHCSFCAVPKIEGELRELKEWRVAPIVCDNNFLVASKRHIENAITRLSALPFVDFNQGLDARLFTAWHADQLARLPSVKVRFAFDHTSSEFAVAGAVERARKAGLRNFGCYVLIGFKDTPDDALYRLEKVRAWKIRPTPMRFQPLNAMRKNEYVAPSWTEEMLRRVMHYYSRLRWLEHIPFKDYDRSAYERRKAVACG